MMEELVKLKGFDSLEEFNRMVSSVDLTTAENLKAFKDWQMNDGTKEGLEKLPINERAN